MSSIRARLTAAYSAALVGTMLVFALALWLSRRAGWYNELHRSVATEAELALNIIRQAERAGEPVTVVRDSVVGPMMTPKLVTLLDGVPHYLIVLDRNDRILYLSPAARALRPDPLARLQQAAITAPAPGFAIILTLGGQRVLLVARGAGGSTSSISRVAVAASTGSADQALWELVGTMLIVGPLLLLVSVGLAYVIAGRAFKPVDRIIDEVRAISDGRSLHRRLPVDGGGDEISRLALTLNEMMGRLESSFAALRRFTADASHELKTPLAVLRADVERAMNPSTARNERLVALEEALHEITRMADLVESLLTLARADEGRFDLHLEAVELEPLTREVFETAVILGEDAGLQVSLPVLEPSSVLGDARRLRQLFLNLVTNAIKYTPTGSVEISLARQGRTAVFSVRDTGIGIAAADLPHVFERFWRADRARSRTADRSGFGLGLSISQWIAEAHGGTISVRSRLGRGSVFTVTLPIRDADAEAAAEVDRERAQA